MDEIDDIDENNLFQCPACRNQIRDSDIHEHIQNCEFYYQRSNHSMNYSLKSSFNESISANLSDPHSESPKSSEMSSIHYTIESIATCPICSEHYRNTSNIPLLLPNCGHTICTPCLREIYNKLEYPTCPICNSKSILKLKHLPVNFALLDLPGYLLINKCMIHSLELVAYCKDDDKVLCGACILDHRTHNCLLFSDPSLIPLFDSKKQEMSQNLEFLTQIKQSWKEAKSEIDNFTEQIDECLEIHSSNIKDIEKKMIKSVHEGKDQCIKELSNLENSGLIKKITSKVSSKLNKIEEQILALTSKLENFDDLNTLEKISSCKIDAESESVPSLEPIKEILTKLESNLNYFSLVKNKSLGL